MMLALMMRSTGHALATLPAPSSPITRLYRCNAAYMRCDAFKRMSGKARVRLKVKPLNGWKEKTAQPPVKKLRG
jgi:hypothetical protein